MPPRPPLNPLTTEDPAGLSAETSNQGQDSTKSETVEAPGKLFPGPWERWDAYYIRNRHVGYLHLSAKPLPKPSNGRVRFEVDDFLRIERGDSSMTQRFRQTSTEMDDGQFVGFDATFHLGPSVTQYSGTLEEDIVRIERRHGDETTTSEIPWKSTYRGLVAVDQSLRRQPMQIGESRTLKMLIPGSYQLATVRLRCVAEASVPMIDGQAETLLEINRKVEIGDQVNESVLWVDDQGGVKRTYTPATRTITYQTDEATATAGLEESVRQGGVLQTKVTGGIERPDDAARVAFLLKPVGQSARKGKVTVKAAPGQLVRRTEDGTYQVLVTRRQVGEAVRQRFEVDQTTPTPADSKPGDVIDSQSRWIHQVAKLALAGRGDWTDREVATEFASTVKLMFKQPRATFTGYRKASDIAKGDAADSTEQAIVLAALLRSQKIPARLAVGVVYAPGDPSTMRYHTWTLAHVDDQWLQLDATRGGLAPPDRLVFATTGLPRGSQYEAIDQLLATWGQFEITIKGTQY